MLIQLIKSEACASDFVKKGRLHLSETFILLFVFLARIDDLMRNFYKQKPL